MEFSAPKARTLAAISAAEGDKSPKGNLDEPIIPLIDAINRHPSYFTTSSCSGRISILSHLHSTTNKKKAGGGGWIFVSHHPADPDAVLRLLFQAPHPPDLAAGDLVFRFEPLIIAVECRDPAAAQLLVSTAIACGFRESGITSIHKRTIVAVRCSIRLEVPLGQLDSILVSAEYVRYLVGLANEKMEVNRRRTDGFLHVLQNKGLPALEQEETVFAKKKIANKAKPVKSHGKGDSFYLVKKDGNDSGSAPYLGEDNGTNALVTSSIVLDQ